MSTWSRSSKRTFLLEGNGFVTSEGKMEKVPGPNSYNTQISPRVRGTTTYAPVHGKSDREKILSNGARVSGLSPLGPGTYNPNRVAGPGSPRSEASRLHPENNSGHKPFGTGTKRAELFPEKKIPGPGDYELSLPKVSKGGKFIDTSPRKCCSPVEKEPLAELSQSQQVWYARVVYQNSPVNNSVGDYGLSDDSVTPGSHQKLQQQQQMNGSSSSSAKKVFSRQGVSPPTLDISKFNQSSGSAAATSARSPGAMSGGGGGISPRQYPTSARNHAISPTSNLNGSMGRSGMSPGLGDSLRSVGGSGAVFSPKAPGPKIKGGVISTTARPMNMHNPNSTLARERDPDFANPPPGSYDNDYKRSKDRSLGGRISQSPRNCSLVNPKSAGVPGPGSYELTGPGSISGAYSPGGA